jgi:hypothetical protein
MGLAGPSRPGEGPVGGQANLGVRRREAAADVESHLDVGPEALLDVDRALGRQAVGRAVVGGAESDSVIVDPGTEGKDLVAPGVGQYQAVPAGEAVEPPEDLDGLHPRTEHEVIGVGQHDRRTQRFQV